MNRFTEYSGARIVLLATLIATVIVHLFPEDLARSIVKEDGPVESLTAVFYIVTALWLFYMRLTDPAKRTGLAGIIVLLLGFRELDLHQEFTTMGILKSRYYISPEVPVVEKTISAIILILIVIVTIKFIHSNFRTFVDGLKSRSAVAVHAAIGIGLMVFSKVWDGFAEPIRPLVRLFYSNPPVSMHITEEMAELAIPLFFFLAAYHYSKGQRSIN